MISLTVNFGAGFITGVLLSFIVLSMFTICIFRRVQDNVKSRDLSADRKTITDVIANTAADVLDHPAVADSLSRAVAAGINAWMSSEEAQAALLQAYTRAPRTQAAREFGKEVPAYVKHFGLGVVDGLRFRNVTQLQKAGGGANAVGEIPRQQEGTAAAKAAETQAVTEHAKGGGEKIGIRTRAHRKNE